MDLADLGVRNVLVVTDATLRKLPPVAIAPFTWIPGPIWFALKIALVLFFFLWVRATFPRYRYDQLMRLGWKWLIPLAILNVVVTGLVKVLV